jgi:glutathione synthase/RimK-type ligase-like ATP-grasp enzyme
MVGGPPLIVKLLEGTQGKVVLAETKKRRKVLSMLSKLEC